MGLRWGDFSETVRRRMKLEGDAARATRAIGGHRAQRSGELFQAEILAASRRQRDIVRLKELPACGAKFVGKREAVPLKIPCDFIGSFVQAPNRGRGLFFDAKKIAEGNAIDLANPHLVKRHQALFLFDQDEAGAVAGLLVKCRAGIGWLPAKHLGQGRARMTWEDPAWVWLEGIDFAAIMSAALPQVQGS